ncbi:MAG: hypothetical protein KF788_10775 [Piscinibacter sp.]|nr:hypothetical protein [Piscinibacter sp.]
MTRLLTCTLLLCALAGPSLAADRPYLVTNSAAAEEDEEQVWAVENWLRHTRRGQRSLTVAPEYSFDPMNSVQAEFRRVLERDDAHGHEIEFEFKHLFTRIERDGIGFGAVLTLDTERRDGEGPLRRRATSLFLPITVPFGEGAGQVHLNPGLAWPREERVRPIGAIAAEAALVRRTELFGEWARDAEGGLVLAGVRYWIRRERLAVDLAWQREQAEGGTSRGVVIGIAWYDL